jgi:hypothetical protein
VLDQFDFVRGKTGDGHGDTILVFALLLDVVRPTSSVKQHGYDAGIAGALAEPIGLDGQRCGFAKRGFKRSAKNCFFAN